MSRPLPRFTHQSGHARKSRSRGELRRQATPIVRLGSGAAKRTTAEPLVGDDSRIDRQLGQERDAMAGGDQLEQRREAGRAEAPEPPRVDGVANRERLVADAMAVLEEEQLVRRDQLGERRRRAACGRPRRRGEQEGILEGRLLLELVVLERQAGDDRVELARARAPRPASR